MSGSSVDTQMPRVTMMTGILQTCVKSSSFTWNSIYKNMYHTIRTNTTNLAPQEIHGAFTRKKTTVMVETPLMIGQYPVYTTMRTIRYKNAHGTNVSNFMNAIDFKYTTSTGKRGVKIYTNGKVQVSGFKSEDEMRSSTKELLSQIVKVYKNPLDFLNALEDGDDVAYVAEVVGVAEVAEVATDGSDIFDAQDLDLDLDFDFESAISSQGLSNEIDLDELLSFDETPASQLPVLEEALEIDTVTITASRVVLFNAMWRIFPTNSKERMNFHELVDLCNSDKTSSEFTAHYNAEQCPSKMKMVHHVHGYKLIVSIKGSVIYTHCNDNHLTDAFNKLKQLLKIF